MADGSSQVSATLVSKVAERAAVDPVELPVLYDQLDSDALDSLVAQMDNGEVAFEYAGFEVVIDSSGAVDLESLSLRGPIIHVRSAVG